MSGIWLVSYIALWLILLVLTATTIVLARQIGLLNIRLGPVGARMTNAGPDIGEQALTMEVLDHKGRIINLGGNRDRSTLMVFTVPGCKACGELAPALISIHKSEHLVLDIILISLGGGVKENLEFIEQHKLSKCPYVTSLDVGIKYGITTTPYALLVDREGVVRSKGIVNNIEHLESLLNAENFEYIGRNNHIRSQYAEAEITART
jgi:methylamine dehydrogenase accessory protein MauD